MLKQGALPVCNFFPIGHEAAWLAYVWVELEAVRQVAKHALILQQERYAVDGRQVVDADHLTSTDNYQVGTFIKTDQRKSCTVID